MTSKYQRRLGAFFTVLLFMFFAACASFAFEAPGDVRADFEGGSRFTRGSVNVAVLRGTWREMGRQYGALLSAELQDIYRTAILGEIAAKKPENMDVMKSIAQGYYATAPFTFRELVKGMAETSGLSQDELLLVNCVEMSAGLSLCSGVAAWGECAKDGLVYGRNYDYFPEWFKKLDKDIVIAVFHPADGSIPAATIGYAGEMYAVNGLNAEGIFLELNNGTPSGGSIHYDNRTHSTQTLFALLFDAQDMKYEDTFFHTTNTGSSFIIGVADKKEARAYEWAFFDVKRSAGASKDGLMVITNHFTDESWGIRTPSDGRSWNSLSRRKNLQTLAEKHRGAIDAKVMMKIIETPYEKGGAATAEGTMYQLTVKPQDMALWIRIPGLQDWTHVDMGKLLSGRGEK